MKNIVLLSGATAILAALSVPAFAQTEIATGARATGVAAVEDSISDIEDDVQDSFDRSNDADRFGPSARRQGLFGNMSLSYSGSTGNTDSQDLSVAGRINHNAAPFEQSIGLAIEFGENDDGEKDKEELRAVYDARYYINDRFYGFGLGRVDVDGLATGDETEKDGFLGFGPGYRVINTDTTTWRVQAGPGVRYTKTAAGESDTEVGYIASSRVYHSINAGLFITNDTDILSSKTAGETVTNELGLNFKISDQLATRASYTTEYKSERDIRTDNTLGLAVVYGF